MTPDEQVREVARLDFDANTKETAARLGYQINLGVEVFKALMLVNGGAMIALFTLLGNLSKMSKATLAIRPSLLWWSFGSFSLGLACAVTAAACGFLSQSNMYVATQHIAWNNQADLVGSGKRYDPVPSHARGSRWITAATVLILLAIVAFVAGSGVALAAVLPGA